MKPRIGRNLFVIRGDGVWTSKSITATSVLAIGKYGFVTEEILEDSIVGFDAYFSYESYNKEWFTSFVKAKKMALYFYTCKGENVKLEGSENYWEIVDNEP